MKPGRASWSAALVVLALACRSSSSSTTPEEPAEPSAAEEPAEPSAAEEPAEPSADDDPELAACIEACVESRQMQAIGIEVIREECGEECEAGRPPRTP